MPNCFYLCSTNQVSQDTIELLAREALLNSDVVESGICKMLDGFFVFGHE